MRVTPTETLRDRKKRDTRDRIVEVADRLFAERGFAGVTVAQIGAAAGVSAKTVFNYFPVKEGIFFAGRPPLDDRVLQAVRSRPAGESAYEAVRRQALHPPADARGLTRAVRERGPDETVYEAIERFRAAGGPGPPPDPAAARARTWRASPELQRYVAEQFSRAEDDLAAVLAGDTGAAEDDPIPAVAAAALLAPLRAAVTSGNRMLAAGRAPGEVARRREADLVRAYDLLAPALAGYARR